MRRRRRVHLPYCHWYHPFGHYAPPPWWSRRPSKEEEKEEVKDHIEMLKEEIEAAEEYLKELEKSD